MNLPTQIYKALADDTRLRIMALLLAEGKTEFETKLEFLGSSLPAFPSAAADQKSIGGIRATERCS